jgi:cyclopropane fatty-acyl-phospholipid synthase-like methyltransferase
MEQLYHNGAYADRNPSWHEEDAPWKATHVERMIRKHGLPRGKLCEIGCGTGEILLHLEHAFPEARLCGYDISPQAYARAKAKETPRARFFMADVTAAGDEKFDVALAIDIVEHVEDYIFFLKRLKTIAEYKIFHIPLDLSTQSLLRSWPIMRLRSDVGHLHYFFKDSALATLQDCGYSIIDHHYTASRLELPNQALSSRVMKLPRRALYAMNKDFAVRLLGGYSLMVLAR